MVRGRTHAVNAGRRGALSESACREVEHQIEREAEPPTNPSQRHRVPSYDTRTSGALSLGFMGGSTAVSSRVRENRTSSRRRRV